MFWVPTPDSKLMFARLCVTFRYLFLIPLDQHHTSFFINYWDYSTITPCCKRCSILTVIFKAYFNRESDQWIIYIWQSSVVARYFRKSLQYKTMLTHIGICMTKKQTTSITWIVLSLVFSICLCFDSRFDNSLACFDCRTLIARSPFFLSAEIPRS